MRQGRWSIACVGVLLSAGSVGCSTAANYLEPSGPRFSGAYAHERPVTQPAVANEARQPATLKVVSYNVRYGLRVEEAIALLRDSSELADADVFLLQEMHAAGVDQLARALSCNYVYYPASLRKSGREFGNAVLTRGQIVGDAKVLLPHANPFNRQHRIAVRTDIALGERRLRACSVHTETPVLALQGRDDQIDAMLRSVATAEGPCLVAGDFNTLASRSLRRFDRTFAENGFERASAGVGTTFSFGPLRYAMDHVFARGLRVVDAGRVLRPEASDHVPVWVEFAWNQQEGGA